MLKYSIILFISSVLVFNSCSNGQGQTVVTDLSPVEFAEKMKALPDAPLVDVRTPGEFSNGHLSGAVNIDWNGSGFDSEISKLDKSKPVFVYCLSGGRSGEAAGKMRADGFKEVYELKGGITKWRAANLPETSGSAASPTGMSKQQFEELLNTQKLMLVDFYADWCAPCKKMKPYLEEIARDMKDRVVVLRINADENKTLAKELNVDALPTLILYKNQTVTWRNTGYIDKDAILKVLQ